MPAAIRVAILAFNFVILSVAPLGGSGVWSFAFATLLVASLNLFLVAGWDRGGFAGAARWPRGAAVVAVAATIAAALLVVGARRWLSEILIHPHDPMRADMLIVIQQAIRRFLQGRNPYATYHVPWDATLPYGPLLWGPYVLPHVLHADVRFVSVAGALFLPAACAVAATTLAARGAGLTAALWLVVLGAIVLTADIRGFISIGHTPVYWPLLVLFAWLIVAEEWTAAAVVSGLLIVARTTMVACAPIIAMAVWHRQRAATPKALALLAVGALIPFVPFAIWDVRTLAYGLIGSYESLMKGFVWTSTDWVQRTVGITGLLLRAGWQRWSEVVQIVVLVAVYAAAWRAIAAKKAAAPWVGLALLAFSMTTLWPVGYIYLDVFLFFAAAALAESLEITPRAIRSLTLAALVIVAAVLAGSAFADIPRDPTVDVGAPSSRSLVAAGFTGDERDGDVTFAWVVGTEARLLLPRRSRDAGDVRITCRPFLPNPDATQDLHVALNGVVLGTSPLHDGWQTVSFTAPARAWQIGVNELTLAMSSAVSPLESGTGRDPRRLSIAVDRVIVR